MFYWEWSVKKPLKMSATEQVPTNSHESCSDMNNVIRAKALYLPLYVGFGTDLNVGKQHHLKPFHIHTCWFDGCKKL